MKNDSTRSIWLTLLTGGTQASSSSAARPTTRTPGCPQSTTSTRWSACCRSSPTCPRMRPSLSAEI
ncbi:hypothetical protein C6A85_07775, partial [Mycobacterium sp. ITM-2017-0098]